MTLNKVSGKLFTAVWFHQAASITFNFNHQDHQPDEIRADLTCVLAHIAHQGITQIAYFYNHEEHGIISECLQQAVLDCHGASAFSGQPKIFLDDLSGSSPTISGVELVDIRWWLIVCRHLYDHIHVDWKQHSTLVYLPGKPQKIERSLVLYTLSQSALNEHLVYSFRPQMVYDPDHNGFLPNWMVDCSSLCASFVEHVGIDWIDWSKDMAREIDLSEDSGWQEWTATGREGEQILNHRLRIVTETWASKPDFLTEKTFMPLVIGVPFLLWDVRNVEFLESMGFKTFDRMVSAHLNHSDNLLIQAQHQIQRAELFWRLSYNAQFQDHVDAIIMHNHEKIREYWYSIKVYHKFLIPLLYMVYKKQSVDISEQHAIMSL